MARSKREIEVTLLTPRKNRKGNQHGSDDHPSKRPKKKVLKGTRKWVSKKDLDICGQGYDVMIDPDYDPAKWEGACTWSDNLIEILEQAEDRMHDALMHEIIHGVNDASGLKWAIAQLFPKLTLKERRLLDETICRFQAPALLATFRGAGWLRLPPKPRRR